MFQRMIEDFKANTRSAFGMTSIVALGMLALFLALLFLCAAAFIAVLREYGPIEACLCVAGIFFVLSLIAGAVYLVKKRRAQARAEAAARRAAQSAASSMLADPTLLAAGLQIVRAVGIKKLVPLLAIGGLALGFFVNRNAAQQPADDETTNAEN